MICTMLEGILPEKSFKKRAGLANRKAFKWMQVELLSCFSNRNVTHTHSHTAALWPRGVILVVPGRPEVM